jgi:succinoglycan biosynthesis protein ExoM
VTAPTVSVVIPCYDRLALLERTLRACIEQKVNVGWEIVVADNHPDQLAAALVAGLPSPVPLRHVQAGVAASPRRPVR